MGFHLIQKKNFLELSSSYLREILLDLIKKIYLYKKICYLLPNMNSFLKKKISNFYYEYSLSFFLDKISMFFFFES